MIKALLNGTPRYSHPVQPHKCLDVRLNSVVKTVTQGAHGCAVQLEDGSELQCDVVVLSVPLGVLKASIQQQHTPQDDRGVIGFDPPLSHRKKLAIERLGFGVENKVLLQFADKFWPEQPFIQCTDKRFRFLNLDYYGKAGVVVGHVAPPFSMGYDGMTDHQVAELAASVFGAMFGRAAPAVLFSSVTRWDKDPFARGSYSFAKVGSNVEEECTALGSPEGRVYFAGEACSAENMQCVHGALQSGQHAAADIVEQLQAGRLCAEH
eukprot:TRINITY_DN4403_c0_g1_i2.p1 TRINITY_DN4403_c0_g1~~TRINITY_DN4403_c0_g1_i2.p1  ORF type:complete len:265 (-),score=82.24 TRINITY_DN4403_c0_g1_i2:126-920(-)